MKRILLTVLIFFLIFQNSYSFKIQVVSENSERLIANEVANEVSKMYGGGKRDVRIHKIYKILKKLNKVSKKDRSTYFFLYVLEMGQPNAISCGDTLYVSTELLDLIETEDELAFIIGHEIGHTTRQHLRKTINQIIIETWALAIAYDQIEDENVRIGMAVAANLINLGWSREHEREADTFGLKYMTEAGYNPLGAISILFKLGGENAGYAQKLIMSHPPTPDRMKKAIREIKENKWETNKPMGLIYDDDWEKSEIISNDKISSHQDINERIKSLSEQFDKKYQNEE